MAKSQIQRISIGFTGGQVLALRVTEAAHGKLLKALGAGEAIIEVESEDGPVTLRGDSVDYVRLERDEPRVGFGL